MRFAAFAEQIWLSCRLLQRVGICNVVQVVYVIGCAAGPAVACGGMRASEARPSFDLLLLLAEKRDV